MAARAQVWSCGCGCSQRAQRWPGHRIQEMLLAKLCCPAPVLCLCIFGWLGVICGQNLAWKALNHFAMDWVQLLLILMSQPPTGFSEIRLVEEISL